MDPSHEPPFTEDDTRPTQTVPIVGVGDGWKTIAGFVSLLAALGFMLGAVVLILTPPDDAANNTTPGTMQVTAVDDTQDVAAVPATSPDEGQNTPLPANTAGLPVVDSVALDASLTTPLEIVNSGEAVQVSYSARSPFTIVPDRPRDQMEQYTVVKGDTIESIATRFGLETDAIVWSNPRRIIQVVRPGDVLNIPPTNGVFIYAQGVSSTLADYAERYEVSVESVLSHPTNRGIAILAPDTVPSSGTPIFFPGGKAELIVWQADIEVGGSGVAGATSGGGAAPTVRFQAGQPGDCGQQAIVGGTQWTNPVPGGYTITTGYSSYHPALDLANVEGARIVAANGGRVIFAGWNSFGYGNMVAIIHGPTMTVYGHLSAVQVSCGKDVAAGQQIGLMGSTGRSSGPHLHFEIRGAPSYLPYNPGATIGF